MIPANDAKEIIDLLRNKVFTRREVAALYDVSYCSVGLLLYPRKKRPHVERPKKRSYWTIEKMDLPDIQFDDSYSGPLRADIRKIRQEMLINYVVCDPTNADPNYWLNKWIGI